MKRFFLDTNIIVDFLACRQPFAIHAQRIFQSAEQGEIQVYLSSHSLATTYYLLQKHSDDRQLRKALLAIVQACHVVVIDAEMMEKALRSKMTDMEDALQLECAYSVKGISGIVTRNIKDFKDSKIPVFPPEKVLL